MDEDDNGKFRLEMVNMINPHSVNHDYCRFQPVLLVDQITDIENKICV